MGWNNRVDVARHKALKVLKDAGAWDELIVPTFQVVGTEEEDDDGTAIVPSGTRSIFTEGLLRNILDLHPSQQVELCGYLAKGKDKKGHTALALSGKLEVSAYTAKDGTPAAGLSVVCDELATLKAKPKPKAEPEPAQAQQPVIAGFDDDLPDWRR